MAVRLESFARQMRLPEAASPREMKLVTDRAKRMLDSDSADVDWRPDMQAKIGGILIKILKDTCKIDAWEDGQLKTVPAFWHQLEQGPDSRARGVWKKYGLLYAHPEVMRRMKPHHMAEAFMPQFLPMVVAPVPWQRHNLGGHLTLRSSVMRIRGSRDQRMTLEEADRKMVEGRGPGLSQVYDALNALGATGWRINKDVYKVVEAIWAWGGGVCDIPKRSDVEVPQPLKLGFRMQRTEGGNLALFVSCQRCFRVCIMAYTDFSTPRTCSREVAVFFPLC